MTTIGSRYQLHEQIGAGGMGVVFRATDVRTAETVAIKLLKSDSIAADPGLVERFNREAEALRQLNHPNIVKVLGTLEENNQQYIVMEYVAGGSLYDSLQAGPLPLGRVLNIALDLADAITRAHRLDIIHRDLKPANVLIADDGTPRLTDFGVARLGGKERVTDPNSTVGTLDYLPPEAIREQPADARSDIWSFGVVLFEMLAGKRPFEAGNAASVLMAILTQPPPDLEALRADCPTALVDLVYRMLEKDPDARIPSVRIVGTELEAILQGTKVDTPSTGERGRVSRPIHDEAFATPTPPSDAPKHNLPAQITPFVGREPELNELSKLLLQPDVRLVTIIAPGGMGKTRLSLAAAEQQFAYFPNGMYFVALAPVTTPDFIVSTIAEAVGFQFFPGGEPKQQLLDYFREKHLLLVLDNFEHLLDGAAIVSDILAYAPGLKILATSRERLNLGGEVLFALSGMDFPDWETPEDALEYAAVKLFVQSAKRAQPGFELRGDDLVYLARICRLVAGMPLAIVLAAAWVEMLSLQEIAAEIEKSLGFLETERRDIPERQRSVQGVFAYAWNRLSEDERNVFMKLSVFRGGFTREAAEKVAGATLRVLMGLVNKSLIRRNADSGRYEVHELLRQYGEQQLEADSEELYRIGERHALHYVDFMEKQSVPLRSRKAKAAADEIDMEIDNVRSAWGFVVKFKRTAAISSLARVFWIFFDLRNRQKEGLELLEPAVNVLTDTATTYSQEVELTLGLVLSVQGSFYMYNGATKNSEILIQKGLGILQQYSNLEDTLIALGVFFVAKMFLNKVQEVRQIALQMVSIAEFTRASGDMATALYFLGVSHRMAHEYEKAQHVGETALTYAEESGEPYMQGLCCGSLLGETAKAMGDFASSGQYFLRGMKYFEEADRIFYVALMYRQLVSVFAADGDFEQASRYLQQALQFFTQNGITYQIAACLMDAASLFDAQGQSERAVELLAAIITNPALVQLDLVYAQNLLADLQARLTPDVYAAAVERGKARDLDATVRELLTEGNI